MGRRSIVRPAAGAAALLALSLLAPAAHAARWFDAPLNSQSAGEADVAHVADINGDGIPDVLTRETASPVSSVAIYLGSGDGTFEAPYLVATPHGAVPLAIADFDGDGFLDIACGGTGCSVLFGDGTGHGWTTVDLGPGGGATEMVVGDFDGDGRPDFAVPDYARTLRAYLSRPGRTFVTRTSTYPGTLYYPAQWAIVAADLDRDGRLDFVLSQDYADHDVLLLMGHGDGTFASSALADPPSQSYTARGLAVADVTGDGIPDIVVARQLAVAIHPGRGDGTFGDPTYLDMGAAAVTDVAVVDATGDGMPDLIANCGLTVVARPRLVDGSFGPPISSLLGRTLYPLTVADLDGDERADLVGLARGDYYYGSELYSALGDGAGRFGGGVLGHPSTTATSAAGSGDFDEDGRPDLVLNSPDPAPEAAGLDVALTRPGRTFVTSTHVAVPAWPWGVSGRQVADLNEDGHLDVATIGDGAAVTVLPGLGDGSFGPRFQIPLPTACTWDTLADVTGDGHLDLVAIAGGQLFVLPGLGAGAFGPAVTTSFGVSIDGLVLGDLNSDGRADLVYTSGGRFADRALGTPDGHFVFDAVAAFPPATDGMAIGDADGDGRADLIALVSTCPYCHWIRTDVQVFLQRPDGSMAGPITSTGAADHWAWSPHVLDVDGDGRAEIAYPVTDGVLFGRCDSTGRVTPLGGFGGLVAYFAPTLPLVDLDGDGHLDAVLNDTANRVTVVWGRDPIPPTVALLGPALLPTLTPGSTATIQWQASDNVGVASIDLFVSRHGARGPFSRIALGLADTGEHAWTVTGPLSDSVAFKVVARDAAGNNAHAVSPALLHIVDPLSSPATTLPARLALSALGPNPVRGTLHARLALPHAGRVSLALLDLQGRRVATLMDTVWPAGEHAVDWDASALAPGLYFLRLAAGEQHVIARVVVAR